MATLDRLREIVTNHRSAVPQVRLEGDGLSRRLHDVDAAGAEAPALQTSAGDIVNAAITLGGAVVDHSDGAVIVVDREYRADMLHGRTPIGEIVKTITEGDDALTLMGKAWPSASGVVEAGLQTRLLFLDLETTGLFSGAGTQAFLIGCAAIEGASIRVRQFLLPGFEHERTLLNEMQAWAKSHGARVPTMAARSMCR